MEVGPPTPMSEANLGGARKPVANDGDTHKQGSACQSGCCNFHCNLREWLNLAQVMGDRLVYFIQTSHGCAEKCPKVCQYFSIPFLAGS